MCFPTDIDIRFGSNPPHCTYHGFVLQQHSGENTFGACLRVWSKATKAQTRAIRCKVHHYKFRGNDVVSGASTHSILAAGQTYWIPASFALLSPYPVIGLLSDYLRCIWKYRPNVNALLNTVDVSNILSLPAPVSNKDLYITVQNIILRQQIKSTSKDFNNFPTWFLFGTLSVRTIAQVIDVALSPTGRIIFVSHHYAMLSIVSEAIRQCIRVYNWTGLYIPVVHALQIGSLSHEPGPYILGIGAEMCPLFEPPPDALIVNIDSDSIIHSSAIGGLDFDALHRLVSGLHTTLKGNRLDVSVPAYMRSAYMNNKIVLIGQTETKHGAILQMSDPVWWNQDALLSVMNDACQSVIRGTIMGRDQTLFQGSVQSSDLFYTSCMMSAIIHERSHYEREAAAAWAELHHLQRRASIKLDEINGHHQALQNELLCWKKLAMRLDAFARSQLASLQET